MLYTLFSLTVSIRVVTWVKLLIWVETLATWMMSLCCDDTVDVQLDQYHAHHFVMPKYCMELLSCMAKYGWKHSESLEIYFALRWSIMWCGDTWMCTGLYIMVHLQYKVFYKWYSRELLLFSGASSTHC